MNDRVNALITMALEYCAFMIEANQSRWVRTEDKRDNSFDEPEYDDPTGEGTLSAADIWCGVEGLPYYRFVHPDFHPDDAKFKAVGINYNIDVDSGKGRAYVELAQVDWRKVKESWDGTPVAHQYFVDRTKLKRVADDVVLIASSTRSTKFGKRTVLYTKQAVDQFKHRELFVAYVSHILSKSDHFVDWEDRVANFADGIPVGIVGQRNDGAIHSGWNKALEMTSSDVQSAVGIENAHGGSAE